MMTPQPIVSRSVLRRSTAGVSAAKTEIPSLVFRLEDYPYALSITATERLLRLADVVLAPPPEGAPAHVRGTFAIDGSEPITVYSLRAFWNLPPVSGEAAKFQSLVILRHQNARLALLVDSCQCVTPSLHHACQFALPQPIKHARSQSFQRIVRWQNSLLVVVDAERLVSSLLGDGSPKPPTALCA